MVDLHIHFPMHLLPGVEAPRDVVEADDAGPRAASDGRLRAAVLALAARAFNFRHWDTSWRVTPELLRAGDVGVACSVLYRPFSELDLARVLQRPAGERVLRQARRAAWTPSSTRCGDRRDDRPHGRRPARRRERPALRALHRGRLPPRRDAGGGDRARPRAGRPRRGSTSRSRTSSGAGSRPTRPRCPSCPTRSTTGSSRSRPGVRCHRSARRR